MATNKLSENAAHDFFAALTQLDRLLRSVFRAHQRPEDPGPAAQIVLFLLNRHESLRAKDIAAWMGIDKAPTSRLLADLETSGLIRRDADPEDGRAALVRVTESGKAQVEQLRTRRVELVRHGLDGLEESVLIEATQQMSLLVERLHTNMEQLTPPEADNQ